MKTILIIEDEILIQQSLKKLFERKGLTVDVSASGILHHAGYRRAAVYLQALAAHALES